MGKTLNCIPHRAAGNNILLEYYTAAVNFIFGSFHVVIFFVIIFAFGGSPVSFQGGSNYTITRETPEVAKVGVLPLHQRHNHGEGQMKGTVPVKFLPPVFTRNSRSGIAHIISI